MQNAPSKPGEPSTTEVLTEVVKSVESLGLLEHIYGYISADLCKIVGIADVLSNEQRDAIWDINWDFQRRFPHLDIEIILIQRHGRPLEQIYNGDAALIKRILTPV